MDVKILKRWAMKKLEGKVAIITGSGSGMGAEEALLFAREGAFVVVADKDEARGLATVAKIELAGGRALFVGIDVTKESAWKIVFEQALKVFGKVDILVNNAAVLLAKTLENTSVEEWDVLFDVNAKSVFLGCKHAIPIMREGGGGVIINVSSMFALVGTSGMAAYVAAKSTIRILTKAVAAECASDRIRVNSLNPGLIETPMVRGIMQDPEQHRKYLQRILLGRAGTVEEVARAALFLASDDSSYMTGAELVIDGGYTAI